MGSLKVLLVCATLLVAALVPGPTLTSRPNTVYTVNDTCKIMLNASMNITYHVTANETHNTPVTETLDGVAEVDNTSYCNKYDSAALILTWERHDDQRLLSFNFTANGQVSWEFKNLTLILMNINDGEFPGYPAEDSGTYGNFSRGGLFDDVSSKVEYQRSYVCNANSTYHFKNYTTKGLNVSISVKNFQVQAFEFKNETQFGNARVCVADGEPGSKIVPIAVGAALGVLVIAVIIAYVISKVVNRKKSSYEAL